MATGKDTYQIVCRFCFGKRNIDEIFFDIFTSKVGDKTLFDCIKKYFAVLATTTYKQCLAGRCWTSDYLEVVQFAINDDNTVLRGICVKCLQVLIESISVADRIRSSNIDQFSQPTFETKLKACDLKAKDGCPISHEHIIEALNLKEQSDRDCFANLSNTCRFCLEDKSRLLFDIFTSKIGDNSIVDVIKMCTATYKEQDVHVFVHLRKSFKKTVLIQDYEWPDSDGVNVHRQICLDCLQPLIKVNFLIDRIRKTNAALSLVDLSCNLKGNVGINLLHTTLEKILDKCVLKTNSGDIVSTEQVRHLSQPAKVSDRPGAVVEKNRMLLTPYHFSSEFEDPMDRKELFLGNTAIATDLYVWCKLCDNFIDSRSELDEHILLHVQAIKSEEAGNICKTCLRLIVTGDHRYSTLSNDWKHCSMCKLRKYLDTIDDDSTTFGEFSKLEFD